MTIDKPLDNESAKKEKTSKILFIIGAIIFAFFLIFLIIWAVANISNVVAKDNEKLGTAIGFIVSLLYFGIPSLIFGITTTALNIASLILARNWKVLKIITLSFSGLLLIFDIILFILI